MKTTVGHKHFEESTTPHCRSRALSGARPHVGKMQNQGVCVLSSKIDATMSLSYNKANKKRKKKKLSFIDSI